MTATGIDRLRSVQSVHTKVRRLRYCAVLAELLASGPGPELVLLRGLERWADDHREDLRSYVDSTGVINRTPKATSARRYAIFAVAIDLVGKLAGRWRLSKYGRVLSVLQPGHASNPFELSAAETCFFGQRILLCDADSLLPLMEFVDRRGGVTLREVQDAYQEVMGRRLAELEAAAETSELKQEISASLRRVRAWSNPAAYVEHLAPSRLQWLVDLALVRGEEYASSGVFTLSDAGRTFLEAVPTRPDGLRYVDDSWCENDYFGAFVNAYAPSSPAALPQDSVEPVANRLLSESFRLFRTGTIARIAASQFLLYASIRLASEQGLSPGYEFLKGYLEQARATNTHYTYRWSAEDNDGYILRT